MMIGANPKLLYKYKELCNCLMVVAACHFYITSVDARHPWASLSEQ